MNPSVKMNILLDRIATVVSARRDEVYEAVKAQSPDNLDSAYHAAIVETRWGSDDTPLSMSQDEMEDLVSALECCGPFGPIHQAAIDLAAHLADCGGLIEHKLDISARFSCTLPDQFKGSVADFHANLRFGVGLHASYQRHAKIHGVTCHDTSVELNEGYATIRGELTFSMDIVNDDEPPAPEILKNFLSVNINTDFRAIQEKLERTPVRELKILSSVTR